MIAYTASDAPGGAGSRNPLGTARITSAFFMPLYGCEPSRKHSKSTIPCTAVHESVRSVESTAIGEYCAQCLEYCAQCLEYCAQCLAKKPSAVGCVGIAAQALASNQTQFGGTSAHDTRAHIYTSAERTQHTAHNNTSSGGTYKRPHVRSRCKLEGLNRFGCGPPNREHAVR
jgi:hypothetical protein